MKGRVWDITRREDLELMAAEVLAGVGQTAPGNGAAVIALSGDLGAGKTTFVQSLARHLRVREAVTSPTFVIMKQYPLHEGNWRTLVHIDAYRLESVEELRVLGFSALAADPAALICIEWAEKVAELLPADTWQLRFSLDKDKRIATSEA